ncbi:MAG TPA: hypothetical protein VF733_05860 [Candidatus Saccharimonadales bacterium]
MSNLDHLSPQFGGEVTASRKEFALLNTLYHQELDATVSILAASAMNSGKRLNTPDGALDAWLWRVDGDITDGHYNFATRLSGTIVPNNDKASKAVPDGALTSKIYKPQNSWNHLTRSLGGYGLHVLDLRYRDIDLELTSAIAPSNYARFTHKYSSGETRYRADPEGGNDTTFPRFLSFDEIVTRATSDFIIRHSQEILNDTHRQEFAEAAHIDQIKNTAPASNLPAFREATNQHDDPYRRVNQLARALYEAHKDVVSPALINQLLQPDTALAASWGLLDKNSYHTEKLADSNRAFLTARFEWVQKHAPMLGRILSGCLAANVNDFGRHLDTHMSRVRDVVREARLFRAHLEPPNTHSFDSGAWSVIPR